MKQLTFASFAYTFKEEENAQREVSGISLTNLTMAHRRWLV